MSVAARIPTKEALMRWVDDVAERDGLDCRETLLLTKFAAYAAADMTSWAKVDTLQRQSRSSERKVQYMLRDFEARGYIRRTGRAHTLESGREAPLYVWAGFLEDFAGEGSTGAPGAPERALGCTDEGVTGAQGVHPQIEPIEPSYSSPSPDGEGEERARAREAVFLALERAFGKAGLGCTNRDRARAVLWRRLDEGWDASDLIAAAKAYEADRTFKRKGELGLDHWLHDLRFRRWLPDPQLPLAAPAEAQAETGPWLVTMAALQDRLGAERFGTWLSRAALGQIGEALYVVAWSGVARDWIRNNCWEALTAAWAAQEGSAGRPLTLIAKADFEALVRRGE